MHKWLLYTPPALKSKHPPLSHTLYLSVSYDSQKNQLLFPETALTNSYLYWRKSVFCQVQTACLYITDIKFGLDDFILFSEGRAG
jgi:hypothetical protein